MFDIVVLARKKPIGISLPQNISIQLSSRDWVDMVQTCNMLC